ncbi:transposable element tcb2 transposase [Trichonephila clavipes]|nr:transposable element tcb2 transposase [Trichonephila clavipes]
MSKGDCSSWWRHCDSMGRVKLVRYESPDTSRYDSDSKTMRHPYTSRIATGWLQEHSSEFRHFRWPPKSPDMNIIEYIWDALQRAVQKRSPPPLTHTDLWTALQDS